VLIVDDNETNRLILVRQTESWGLVAHAVGSGREALEQVRRGSQFELGIIDMQMPGMDGMELAAGIRALKSPAELPLVVLTSLGWRQPGAEAMGFAAHLTKPVKPSQLFDVLVGLFGDGPAHGSRRQPKRTLDPGMADRNPLRILVAEDNLVNRKLAVRVLERLGYAADTVNDGGEAVDAVERGRYDVVLMDVNMPEMDGLEATRRIIAAHPARSERPRIVAMTASAMDEDRRECLAAGMDDFIGKPVRFEDLVEALDRCARQGLPGAATEVGSTPLADPGEVA
jgi:CheY-like chemotaxis protein